MAAVPAIAIVTQEPEVVVFVSPTSIRLIVHNRAAPAIQTARMAMLALTRLDTSFSAKVRSAHLSRVHLRSMGNEA